MAGRLRLRGTVWTDTNLHWLVGSLGYYFLVAFLSGASLDFSSFCRQIERFGVAVVVFGCNEKGVVSCAGSFGGFVSLSSSAVNLAGRSTNWLQFLQIWGCGVDVTSSTAREFE